MKIEVSINIVSDEQQKEQAVAAAQAIVKDVTERAWGKSVKPWSPGGIAHGEEVIKPFGDAAYWKTQSELERKETEVQRSISNNLRVTIHNLELDLKTKIEANEKLQEANHKLREANKCDTAELKIAFAKRFAEWMDVKYKWSSDNPNGYVGGDLREFLDSLPQT